MSKDLTRLPYRQQIIGEKEGVTFSCYISNPPENLTENRKKQALNWFRANSVDKSLRLLTKKIPGHSKHDVVLKLAAINTLANANCRHVAEVSDAVETWERIRQTTLAKLIESGSREQAENLMNYVELNCGKATSLLSKYLAYHRNHWMIYDSYVSCYVWAWYKGLTADRLEPQAGYKSRSEFRLKRRELDGYVKYCEAIDWVWSQLPIASPKSDRMREGVFWHRAKHCAIRDIKP